MGFNNIIFREYILQIYICYADFSQGNIILYIILIYYLLLYIISNIYYIYRIDVVSHRRNHRLNRLIISHHMRRV